MIQLSLTATGETFLKMNTNWQHVELQNVKIWLDANKLTLNEEKTEYMLNKSAH
jgi:hypothetical protein